ncbi:hypothetical protein LOTGIDRAFT_164234 [Lottia gigantea]|uniref:Helicase ATP-binding domain-containing protein n=1 Tax=Lottia gigantea TaxID=225164 RepID=V4BMV9_LOTGI|nr:hypothetical protein LOTGIDRAFT_164234 [Lottia gigantea]ESO90314.1 hypothetical protein LOTGIDRAFT_164234 [Lottia gigantea]
MTKSTGVPSEESKQLIEAMKPKLKKNLEPSEILKTLKGFDRETHENIVGTEILGDREGAVDHLIDAVLKQNIVGEFFQVLRQTGYLDDGDELKVPDETIDVYSPASGPTDQGQDLPIQGDTSRSEGDEDANGFSDEEEEMEASENADELPMRKYQYELSQAAIEGENTIICAPTGSGKTRVALYIVRKHLSDMSHGGKKKIVFLARTTLLVNQQAKTFRKHLPPEYSDKVCDVTGESGFSTQLHTAFDFYNIVVLTPQILDNNLKDGKIKSLSEFSLLILDECHHTRKGEPYNNLMKKYLKAKNAREDGLPQIIGLTASLGVEKATTVGEATISILKLCANLDVEKLSTVTVHKEELERTVPKPDERRVKLHGSRCDEARDQIHDTMLKIENHLDEAVLTLRDRGISALKKKRPSNLNSQSYGQWAVKIKRSTMEIIGQTEEAKALTRTIIVTARQLEVYNASMDIHDLVRLSDVLEYLERNLTDNLEKDKHFPVEDELSKYFTGLKLNLRKIAIKDENPNLRILKDEIIKLRNEKGDDSLGIIFVRTRGTCYAIRDWMKSDRELRKLNF